MNKYKIMWGIGLGCYVASLVIAEDSIKGLIQIGLIAGMFLFMNASQNLKDNAHHDKCEKEKKQ